MAPTTEITWAIRREATAALYGGGNADALPERGKLGSAVEMLVDEGLVALVAGVAIDALRRSDDGVVVASYDSRSTRRSKHRPRSRR